MIKKNSTPTYKYRSETLRSRGLVKEYPTWVSTTAIAANRRRLVRLFNRGTSLRDSRLNLMGATSVVGTLKVLWTILARSVTRTYRTVRVRRALSRKKEFS